MNGPDENTLGRSHWLNYPFLIFNAGLFIYGVYTIFAESVAKGIVLVGVSVVLSFLVPTLLGKLVRRKYDL